MCATSVAHLQFNFLYAVSKSLRQCFSWDQLIQLWELRPEEGQVRVGLRRDNMALDYKTKTMIIWSRIHIFTVSCWTQGPRRILKIWPWTWIQGPIPWKYDLGLWLEAAIHICMATCWNQGLKMTMNILSWAVHQSLGLRPYLWGFCLFPQVWQDQDHDNMVLDSAFSLNLRLIFHDLGLALRV